MKFLKVHIWPYFFRVFLFLRDRNFLGIGHLKINHWVAIRLNVHRTRGLSKKINQRTEFQNGTDIVVCVHNAPEEVAQCLSSVAQHTNLKTNHLIIVDDGSSTETRKILAQYASRLGATLVRNESALGYTRAANRGLKLGNKKFVVLLNSDTIVGPEWLESMVQCATSEPGVGAVGPLSNAASWQSIPEWLDPTGQWKVNELPADSTLEKVCQELRRKSSRIYPNALLLNGFCLLLARNALLEAGYLDEESFPRGYGEEDDLIIRIQKKGFHCLISDDTYVYHHKSKSFTKEGRLAIVEHSKKALQKKHGAGAVQTRVRQMATNEELLKARWIASQLWEKKITPSHRLPLRKPIKILWLSPHLGKFGGIRRLVEMSNLFTQGGHDVTISTPSGGTLDWLPLLSKVEKNADIENETFDVAICCDPTETALFLKVRAKTKIVYHLAAYNLYRPQDPDLTAFYSLPPDILHIANSQWTADQVRNHYPRMSAIIPGGVRTEMFRPIKTDKKWDICYYGSKRHHKGSHRVEEATFGLKVLVLDGVTHSQEDLVWGFNSSRLFVSACYHEGFNFMPLEAMACGTPVVVMDDGGCREYAVHEKNCLLVDQGNIAELTKSIRRLLSETELRNRLILQGLETASKFTWAKCTEDLARVIDTQNDLIEKTHGS